MARARPPGRTRFSGGISAGVRAMASPAAVAAQARHLRASGAVAAPALAKVQMNDRDR